jgi:hypothetical protein
VFFAVAVIRTYKRMFLNRFRFNLKISRDIDAAIRRVAEVCVHSLTSSPGSGRLAGVVELLAQPGVTPMFRDDSELLAEARLL